MPAPALSDPVLIEMDWILDDPEQFGLVQSDLRRHYRPSTKGRHPIAVEVTLRMIVLHQRKNWPCRQLKQEVHDNDSINHHRCGNVYVYWSRSFQCFAQSARRAFQRN